MNKLAFKLSGKVALKAVVSIAGIISTVDGIVSGHKKAKEFETLKQTASESQKAISELQKAVSELQNR